MTYKTIFDQYTPDNATLKRLSADPGLFEELSLMEEREEAARNSEDTWNDGGKLTPVVES